MALPQLRPVIREPWQEATCPHTRSGVCLANCAEACVCQNGYDVCARMVDNLNGRRQSERERIVEYARNRKRVRLWTIYEHPPSHPDLYVARRSNIDSDDPAIEHLMLSSDLQAIRDQLHHMRLTCLGRDPADPRHIIEVWL